jgi:2-C-methyl-D-erythritol 4-phosphate cytidylyltransferase
VPLAGKPLVEWSIEAMRAAPGVGAIIVACPPGHVHELAGGDIAVVDGGATRAHSVANALEAVDTELVAIHDAARPLVTPELVEGVVATLAADPEADGAIAATPITDTIKRTNRPRCSLSPDNGEREQCAESNIHRCSLSPDSDEKEQRSGIWVEGTVDRGALWAAQTPQVFRVEVLRRALVADPGQVESATDEAMLVEAAGGRVLIHPAPPENLKVTTPLDLRLAELLLADR